MKKMETIILTEKPSVAERLASLLSEGKARAKKSGKITTYTFSLKDGEYTVASTSGHVVSLDYPKGSEWTYPAVIPPEDLTYKRVRGKSRFLTEIKRAGKGAEMVVAATDLDTEGSAIALEVVEVLKWGKKELKRMEFSSLSPKELRGAFDDLKPFDYPRARAGFSRQVLDLEWGANVTRGLTLSTRKHRWVRVLSGGRVQTPTLRLIVDRENEIRAFVPQEYYEVTGIFDHEGQLFEAKALPPKGQKRITDESYAELLKKECEKEYGKAGVRSREVVVQPPVPFDGTTMQIDISRITGLTPRQIADRRTGIAQQLYEAGLISYIGTESQKYPKDWRKGDFDRMLEVVRSYPPLREQAEWVIANRRRKPKEGKKEDPAHPCVHVVGAPKTLGQFRTGRHRKVYEIIARRVLATLSLDGVDRRTTIDIEIKQKYKFRATGKVTLEEGWRRVYPYSLKEEKLLPPVEDGDRVLCVEVRVEKKQTQPPRRYAPVSIIRKMEELGLGTKNTRTTILDILGERDYVRGKTFRPTALGEVVVAVLVEHVPEITSPEMTSQLDEAMSLIEAGELDHSEFLGEALSRLDRIMKEFKREEEELGKEIARGLDEYRRKASTVGVCPSCGNELVIRRGKYGKFVACKGYPECRVTFNLHARESVLEQNCECGLPLVRGTVRTKSGKTLTYRRCLVNCPKTPLRCRKCGAAATVKKGRYGTYVSCLDCGASNYFTRARVTRGAQAQA